jgi:hypothetical protein
MVDEIKEFLAEFQKETDRAAAVLAAAYLDIGLKRYSRRSSSLCPSS